MKELIRKFKETKSQEIYNKILIELFTKCENTTLWLEAKEIENGITYRTLKDENGNVFLLANTENDIIKQNSNIGVEMTIKGIFETVLNKNNCFGLIIDYDENSNQFILLKEYIIKIFNECE